MKCFYDVEISTNEKIESSQIVKVELDGFSRKITAENELKKSLAETYGSNFKIFERFNPIPAIVFLAIAVFLTFFKFDLKTGTAQLELLPNGVSLILSIAIYSAVVLRVKGFRSSFNTPIDVIVSVLTICLLATFIKVLLNDAVESSGIVSVFLEKIGMGNSLWLIILAVVLSWLGMKNISKYVYLIVAVLGFVELCSIDGFMGEVLCVIFLLSSFLGFVFYLKYEGKLITDSLANTVSSIISKTGITNINTDGEKLGEDIRLYIENKKLPPKINESKPKEKKTTTKI